MCLRFEMTLNVEKGSDEERTRGSDKKKKNPSKGLGQHQFYEAAAEQPSGFSLNYIISCEALSWL